MIHGQEWVIIEKCFGQLIIRFPILGNCYTINHSIKVVVICVVLHISKHLNDSFDYREIEIDTEDVGRQQEENNKRQRWRKT